MVALIPHINETQDPDQTSLYGFHVCYMPYLNDVRKFPYEDLVGSTTLPIPGGTRSVPEVWRAERNQIEAAKAIVKKMVMQNGYSPELFEDPVLHTKWKLLEGRALERSEVEPVEDNTLPNCESIDKRLGTRASTFNDLVFPMDYQSEYTHPVSKAKGPGNDAAVEDAARKRQVLNCLFPFFKFRPVIYKCFCCLAPEDDC